MNKDSVFQWFGFGVLATVMILGVLILWNARAAIAMKVATQEEAQRPAAVELILVAPSDCTACVDGEALLEAIEKQDVRILASQTLSADSKEGASMVAAYGITRLPAVLIKGEYRKDNVREAFDAFGGEEKDDALVIQPSGPVYADAASGRPVGLVDVTFLTDSDCADCYDPTALASVLGQNFGMAFGARTSVDIETPEGRALREAYAITQVPTAILSGEVSAYARLADVWKQVGSVEADGMFVFRHPDALGGVVYRDLETGEVVRPQPPKE